MFVRLTTVQRRGGCWSWEPCFRNWPTRQNLASHTDTGAWPPARLGPVPELDDGPVNVNVNVNVPVPEEAQPMPRWGRWLEHDARS